MSGKIIVRTMNVGMCNQLFTYAFARKLANEKNKELYLDYSHTSKVDMKHSAMYEDCLAHLGLDCEGVINSKDEYGRFAGRAGRSLERLINPLFIRKRNRLSYVLKKEENELKKLAKKGICINLLAERKNQQLDSSDAENIIVYGYWQVPDFARELELTLRNEIYSSNAMKSIAAKGEKVKACESVCVHIRRGDYVGNSMHQICTPEYYENAMEYYRRKLDKPIFYIFSDDKEYVRSKYGALSDVVIVDDVARDYEELLLMSCCKSFVLSNSSFSWWAQFLSGSSNVVAPSRWYGALEKQSLLYEKHWRLLGPKGEEID